MSEATLTKPDDFFCSVESRDRDESLLGSAPRADVWFMLEYGGRWGSKAFDESDIAQKVKDKVNGQLAEIPNSRLLLIKQGDVADGQIAFYAAVPVAEEPRLYHFTLGAYEDLLDLDLEAIADGREKYAGAITSEKLLLVCTNGLRDKCCALNGVKAHATLSGQFGDLVWESSHHGGHRYGANMLAMPHGLSYGRVDLEGGAQAVQAYLDDEIWLDNLRGRSSYDKLAQAAEGLVRRESGLLDVDALELADVEETEGGQSRVRFQQEEPDQVHEAIIKIHTSEHEVYVSCEGDKRAPLVTYELTDYNVS